MVSTRLKNSIINWSISIMICCTRVVAALKLKIFQYLSSNKKYFSRSPGRPSCPRWPWRSPGCWQVREQTRISQKLFLWGENVAQIRRKFWWCCEMLDVSTFRAGDDQGESQEKFHPYKSCCQLIQKWWICTKLYDIIIISTISFISTLTWRHS